MGVLNCGLKVKPSVGSGNDHPFSARKQLFSKLHNMQIQELHFGRKGRSSAKSASMPQEAPSPQLEKKLLFSSPDFLHEAFCIHLSMEWTPLARMRSCQGQSLPPSLFRS